MTGLCTGFYCGYHIAFKFAFYNRGVSVSTATAFRLSYLLLLALFMLLPAQQLFADEQLSDQDVGSAASDDTGSIQISEDPQLLVSVYPEQLLTNGVYEQSQIVLTIRVASKYPFDALNLDFPAIEGVEQVELARPRNREITGYAGDGFLHEQRYALFAQAPGILRIPPASVTGLLATGADSQIAFKDDFAGLQIAVKAKPDSYQDDWWLASSNVALQESWSIPLEETHVSDVVTRTITLRVSDVDASRLPELVHGNTRGVSVRELGTTRETIKSSRGLTGVITSSWALKIEDHDVVFISPIGLAYWDTLQDKRNTVAVRGHRIEPLALDSEAIASRLLDQSIAMHRTAYKAVIGLLMLLLIPLLCLAAYGLSKIYLFSHDHRFRSVFLRTNSEQSAYRVWLDWSSAEPCRQSEQWHVLNRNLQRCVFSRADETATRSSLDRKKLFRQSLSCARHHRFKELVRKINRVFTFFFGARSEL